MSQMIPGLVARRLADLRESAKAGLTFARERVANGIADGYTVDAYAMKVLAHAQGKARAVHFIRCVEGADHGKVMESLRAARDELSRDVVRAARGAADSGEMNSTCAFTRASAAAVLAATAEVLESIETMIELGQV
jgi:hypothetical protein